jgi:hypothetical protein
MPWMKRRATAFLMLICFAIFVLCAALIVLMTRPARATPTPEDVLPAGVTCDLIREKVAEYGKLTAWAWALKQGYSLAQIRVARRCLK